MSHALRSGTHNSEQVPISGREGKHIWYLGTKRNSRMAVNSFLLEIKIALLKHKRYKFLRSPEPFGF